MPGLLSFRPDPRGASTSAARRAPAPLIVALALAGCGHPRETQELVHGRDISVTASEYDQLVTQIPADQGSRADRVRRTILEGLIDQKLLAQRAMDQKLDRTPAVMQRIEAARRTILAEADAERATARSLTPDRDAARAYYDAHPALFAQRRVVEVEELELDGSPADLARYKAAFLKSDGSLAAMQAALAADGRPNTTFVRLRAPEDLPGVLVASFAALRPGQPVVYALNGSLNLGVVRQVQAAPLPFALVEPVILRLVADQHRRTILEGDLKALRARADLRYDGSNMKRAGIAL